MGKHMEQQVIKLFHRTLGIWLICVSIHAHGQSNLVYNGSFEIGAVLAGWSGSSGGSGNELGAADGYSWATLGLSSAIYQDLNTVTGRVYRLRLAVRGCLDGLKLNWGNTLVDTCALGSPPSWTFAEYAVLATNTSTRLGFANTSACAVDIDAISVSWVDEPPSIIRQVVSRSAFEGATIALSVKAAGAPFLKYQWFLKDQPVTGATNAVLVLTNVSKANEGRFAVSISNHAGVIRSFDAIVAVSSAPNVPLITSQPKSQTLIAGHQGAFYVTAIGRPPLNYQWFFAGMPMTGQTNKSLVISSVAETDAGSYSVMVSNGQGSATSLPADLGVGTATGSSAVSTANRRLTQPYIDAPIYDLDGVTRLEGPNFLAQLYAGATSNNLRAVGAPLPLRTGAAAGYLPAEGRIIPDVPAGQYVYGQIRVWEAAFGASYEEAAQSGGKFGKSQTLAVIYQSQFPPPPPTPLVGLTSFQLEAGLPLYASAKFERAAILPGSQIEWLVIGEPGASYLVEKRVPPQNWEPVVILTNQTGTTSFVDTNAQNSSSSFYRAQILSQ
jgi:hypothetical protein